jgi:hypothetical protein
VGSFEEGAKLKYRLEEIMHYDPLKRTFGRPCRLAVIAAAVLLLPMSPGPDGRRAAIADQDPPAPAENAKPKDGYPRIVKTSPPQGETGVDPGLKEVSVTFDRDMEAGMSWTGGAPLFPPVDKSRQARWTDKRTCVVPVKLEPGTFYRLGINSSSYQNFRSEDTSVPAASAAIYFSTKGATEDIERRVRVPVVVSLDPPNGFGDVDPNVKSLRVTFNMPMGEGMSWTGGGPKFPKLPDGEKATWSDDGLTCALPVSLEGDHDYELGLNSVSHNNFQSRWGVPIEAVIYKFHTRAAAK